MDILYDSEDGRDLTPVRGRYLVWTNALQIELLDAEKRFIIPLPSIAQPFVGQGTSVNPNRGYAFLIESDGFLLTENKYRLTKMLVGPFKDFYYQLLHPTGQNSDLWTPVTFTINNVTVSGTKTSTVNGADYYNHIKFELFSSLGSFSYKTFLRAQPITASALNDLAPVYLNTFYKGPKQYPGLTLI